MSYAALVAGQKRRKTGLFAELLGALNGKPSAHSTPVATFPLPPDKPVFVQRHDVAARQVAFAPQPEQARVGRAALWPQPRPAAHTHLPDVGGQGRVQNLAPIAATPTAAIAPVVSQPITLPSSAAPVVAKPFALPTATRLQAIRLQQRQQKLVAETNGPLPVGSHVMAWSILPANFFEGDVGRFLMLACDMFACSACNTLLLPVMQSGAEALGLPRHPLAAAVAQQSAAQHKITALYRQAQDDHKRAALALQSGDARAVFSSATRREDYQRQVEAILRTTATLVLGHEAFERHEDHFRAHIDQM